MRPSAVTAVNRAVAVGEAIGAEAGLQALCEAEAPEDWLPYQAARAGLCAKAGRSADAATALNAALALDPAARRAPVPEAAAGGASLKAASGKGGASHPARGLE